MTPLNAADGQIYAVAQGAIIAGGVVAEGEAETVTQGVPTSGLIPAGARVEREVAFDFTQMRDIRLALRNPDFTTAARIEAVINRDVGVRIATMLDSGTVRLDLAGNGIDTPARLMAQIENIEVMASTKARVVVDQRSGTIILGADVRISRVAVTQGNLTLRVEETPLVVQPNPFADGQHRGDPAHRRLDRGGSGHRPRHRRELGVAAGGGGGAERARRLGARHDRHPEVDQGGRRAARRVRGAVTPARGGALRRRVPLH